MSILDVSHVSFVREGKNILTDLSWKIEEGEHWALLGLNGSGKTTLLNILAGLSFPSEGRVSVLGEVFGKANLVELRKKIGWVTNQLSQEIPPADIAERIVLSGKFASRGVWEEVTEKEEQKAVDILSNLGGGHLLGKRFQILSQGEKQLVLLARSLMSQPKLLILDEPMNGLDVFATGRFEQTLKKLSQLPNAPSIVFVTHHTEEIPYFIHQVCLMKNGRIERQGKTESILNKNCLEEFYEGNVKISTLENGKIMVRATSKARLL